MASISKKEHPPTTETMLLAGYWFAGMLRGFPDLTREQIIFPMPSATTLRRDGEGAIRIIRELANQARGLLERLYSANAVINEGQRAIRLTGPATERFVNDIYLWCGDPPDYDKLFKIARSDKGLCTAFLTGIVSLLGSPAASHRHRDVSQPMVSIEIPGFDFISIMQICRCFASIGAWADQVLWNHPSFSSRQNPFYRQWKKGTKLRVRWGVVRSLNLYSLESVLQFASSALANDLTNPDPPCYEVNVQPATSLSVHGELVPDGVRRSIGLPEELRCLAVNFRHFCALVGCNHAPMHSILDALRRLPLSVTPFPFPVKMVCKKSDLPPEVSDVFSWEKYHRVTTIKFDDIVDWVSNTLSVPSLLSARLPVRGEAGNVYGYSSSALRDTAGGLLQFTAGVSNGTRWTQAGFENLLNRTAEFKDLKIEVMASKDSLPVLFKINDNIGVVGPTNERFRDLITWLDPEKNLRPTVKKIDRATYHNLFG